MLYQELDSFEYIDIKPKNYKSKEQLLNDLGEISTTLENITNDWKERELALKEIGSIAKGNQKKSDTLINYFNSKLCNYFEIQLLDLRTSVMKEACRIISLCAKEIGLLIEQGILQLLSQNCLFKIAGSANKVISDSASKCILNLIKYIHSLKIINNICESKTLKSNNVRILCANCLLHIISNYDDNFLIKSKDQIEGTFKTLLSDPNAEVRVTMRKCFIIYKSKFLNEAELLFKNFGKNVQKQITEDEKKVQMNADEPEIFFVPKESNKTLNNINNKNDIKKKPKTPDISLLKNKKPKDKNNIEKNTNVAINKIKKDDNVKYINVDDDDELIENDDEVFVDISRKSEKKVMKYDDEIKNDVPEIKSIFNYSKKDNKKKVEPKNKPKDKNTIHKEPLDNNTKLSLNNIKKNPVNNNKNTLTRYPHDRNSDKFHKNSSNTIIGTNTQTNDNSKMNEKNKNKEANTKIQIKQLNQKSLRSNNKIFKDSKINKNNFTKKNLNVLYGKQNLFDNSDLNKYFSQETSKIGRSQLKYKVYNSLTNIKNARKKYNKSIGTNCLKTSNFSMNLSSQRNKSIRTNKTKMEILKNKDEEEDEENDSKEALDTVQDINYIEKIEPINPFKKAINKSKPNIYHFTKPNYNHNTISTFKSVNYDNFINSLINIDDNDDKKDILKSKESTEEKVNVIIDKLDNLINENEKLILFQYLFNYFNAILKDIKNFSPNTKKRYIDIHLDNLKETDKNLIEQVMKNLMRMIFYLHQIFDRYEIETILKALLFTVNDINDRTIHKLNLQLLDIMKKKCDNEELFKSVYSLLSEYNKNYDDCFEFMILLLPNCDKILNNDNYFKQLFRLICLTDNDSKKVGKLIDLLYRNYTKNFNLAFEEESAENQNKILMFMENSNSLYYREFKSLQKNSIKIKNTEESITKETNENIYKSKTSSSKGNITPSISNKSSKVIDEQSNEDINKSNNNSNNVILNTKNENEIGSINTNLNANNIISINNSHNNNIIITNKLLEDSIPKDIKEIIKNNNLQKYLTYMEEHKSFIPEFILLLTNPKYTDKKSIITLLNFTNELINKQNFTIELNPCINLLIKQIISILISNKTNEEVIELVLKIFNNIPLKLNAEKALSSIAKNLTMNNDNAVLEVLLNSLKYFVSNYQSKSNNSENTPLIKLLDCFIFDVFNLLKHSISEIRKRAIYCCVELNMILGEKFQPFLQKMPNAQQSIIKLYTKKKANK